MPFTPSRLSALLLVVGLGTVELGLLDAQIRFGSRAALAQDAMSLSIRRGQGGVEVVIQGVGPQPLLQQRFNGQVWQGSLQTQGSPGIIYGRQQVSDSVAGLQRVAISGSGSAYRLEVVPVPGQTLQEPVVSADGRNLILQFPGLVSIPTLQTGRLDLTTPGSVPQTRYAPSIRSRAVAPPLGDMAVGTMMLQNRSFVNLNGPPVTLTLKNAPAKDALMSLAKLGRYGFVFVGQTLEEARSSKENADETLSRVLYPVSLQFVDEDYSRAVNSILLASGLQGKLDGKTLLVGENVSSKGFGATFSKTFRLNSVSALSAAMYLGSLGAEIAQVTTVKDPGEDQGGKDGSGTGSKEGQLRESGELGFVNSNTGRRLTTFRSNLTRIDTYGASEGPLKGLSGTTDSRLQTITLVGASDLVEVASNYLKRIDLRQRQVALSVKILDVTLNNDSSMQNDFAFRYGNNFIINDDGRLSASFGKLLPPNSNNFDAIAGGAQSGKPETVTSEGRDTEVVTKVIPPSEFPARLNPGTVYPKNTFFDYLRAQIISGSAKTLASPTMILSENPEPILGGNDSQSLASGLTSTKIGRPYSNETYVAVGTNEITNYTVQAGQNGAPNTCQPKFDIAGLTLGARVKRIDDNGFVTFSLSPAISATTSSQSVEGCGPISVLSLRRLDTGTVRVRDGQTLILTGVIQDSDIQEVTKWPILGDMPLIGQFFRSSVSQRQKRELVILVTPRIVKDGDGGNFGYGYTPTSLDARRIMGSR
jgi:type IV pilus assembly protein PilQ